MVNYLNKLQQSGEKESFIQKKILCIIEGDLEFRYITKIFKLCGYDKGCYELSEDFIKVAWGKNNTSNKNIVDKKCRFQGGTLEGRNVPLPAIDAFEMYEDDLFIFDSIIVFFDSDKDKNREVENYFIKEFKDLEIDNSLLVSTPCFESSLIDFCICRSCKLSINYTPNSKPPCTKYKKSFSTLNCFNGTKHLIKDLNLNNLQKESNLNKTNSIIKKFYNNQKENSGIN